MIVIARISANSCSSLRALRPPPAPCEDPGVFEDRSAAESFGDHADLYDRARPTYPPALIDALARRCDAARARRRLRHRDRRRAARRARLRRPRRRGRPAHGGASRAPRASPSRCRRSSRGPIAGAASSSSPPRRHGIGSSRGPGWRRRRACSRTAAGSRCSGTYGDPPEHVRSGARADPRAVLPPSSPAATKPSAGARSSRRRSPRSPPARTSPRRRSAASRGSGRTDALEWVEQLRTQSHYHGLEEPRRGRLLEAVRAAIDALGGSLTLRYETALVSAALTR